MKEAIGRVLGTAFAPTMQGATNVMSDIANQFAKVETNDDGSTKKDDKGNPIITLNPDMLKDLMHAEAVASSFAEQMKEIGQEARVVVVPAIRLIGTGLEFAAMNAKKLVNGAVVLGGVYYTVAKGSAIFKEFNAAFNNTGVASTKLGKLIQAEYAKEAMAAQESAAKQAAAENELTVAKATALQQQAAVATVTKKVESTEALAQAKVTEALAKEQIAQQNLLLAQQSENTEKISIMQAKLEAATIKRGVAEEKLSTLQQENAAKVEAANIAVTESQVWLNAAVAQTAILRGEEGIAAKSTAATETAGASGAVVAETTLTGTIARNEIVLTEEGGIGAIAGTKIAAGATAGSAAEVTLTASALKASGAMTAEGTAATVAGATTVTKMGEATGAISKVTKALFLMSGGWVGVAAAIGLATYELYKYATGYNRVKSYNKKAEIKYASADGGKYFKKVEKTPEDYAEEIKDGDTGTSLSLPWKWVELSPDEYQAQYSYDEKHKYDDDPEAQAEQQQKDLDAKIKKQQEDMDSMLAGITGKYSGDESAGEKGKHKKDNSNKAKAFDFFTEHGFTPEQAAGIVGHLMVESGGSGDLDPTVTADDGAFGIAQWTDAPRVARMNDYMDERGLDKNDLYSQLNFMMEEFKTTESDAYDKIQRAKTVDDAVDATYYYERPADWHNEARNDEASEIYSEYGSGKDTKQSINKRVKQFDDAKKALEKLLNDITTKTVETAGTNYEAKMVRITADIKKKEEALKKIEQKAPLLDTTKVPDMIEAYKKAEIDKYIKKWTEALIGFKNEEASIRARLTGDKSQMIVAEYQAQLAKNDKEAEAKKKELMRSKSDTETGGLIDTEHNEADALAKKKLQDKFFVQEVERYGQEVEYNQLAVQLGQEKARKINEANILVYDNELNYIKTVLEDATLSYEQRLDYEEKLADAVKARNDAESNSSISGGATAAKAEIEQQLQDYKSVYTAMWNSINGTAENGIEKIMTGQEKIGRGMKKVFASIAEDFEKMIAQLLYKASIQDPMQKLFSSFLGEVGGKTADTGISLGASGGASSSDNSYSGTLISLLGNLFGGGSGGGIDVSGGAEDFSLGGFDLSSIGMFAAGGSANGWSLVGEGGPELVNLEQPGRVYNAKETSEALKGISNNNNNGNTIIMNVKTNDAQSFNQSRGQILGGLAAAVTSGTRRHS